MLETIKQSLSSMGINSLPLAIALTIILFFVLRELVTWYWKLNSIVNMLQRIELTLESIEVHLKSAKNKTRDEPETSQEDLNLKRHLKK